ncbi:MAG: TonB-dependent receptor plug domain-containing protein, partial [Candidatus Omnitrophota bacterium]
MHRLRLFVYILIYLFSFCSMQSLVFGGELPDVALERITVTGNRSQGTVYEVADNVIVIDQSELAQMAARNAGEALSYIPGVDILPRSGFGQANSISIQGSDPRQVRFMIDGIPLNSQSSGQVNPSMLPLDNIKRIEIVKGASSSLWGSGLGGVVNIITKDAGTTLVPSGSITSSIAEFHTKTDNAQVSGKAGKLGYYLFSGYMESGGTGIKNDVLEKKGFGKLTYDLDDLGKLNALFGYSGADVNSGEFPDGSWQAQPYRSSYGKIGWEGNAGPADIKLDLKHSRQEVVTRSYLSIADEDPAFLIRTNDYLYQASLSMAAHPREKDILVIGGDFDWDILKSDVYLSEAERVSLQAPFINYTAKFSSV